MPIGICVVRERDVIFVLQADQSCHRIRARTVHTDLAVMVHRHEGKCRINHRVCDRNLQSVDGVDRFPVGKRCSSERIHAQLELRAANGFDIHYILQIAHIRQNKIFLVSCSGSKGFFVRSALYIAVAGSHQFIGTILDPGGNVGVGGTAIRRIVFETAICRRIVGRGNDDAIGEVLFPSTVVNQNCARDYWSRGNTVLLLNNGFHSVGCKHLECGALRRCRQSVRVFAHIQRSANPFSAAIFADRLRDGQDVGLIEGTFQRGPAMAAGAECDQLSWVADIGLALVVLRFQLRYINQHLLSRRFAGKRRKRGACLSFYGMGHGSAFQTSVAYC